MANHVVSYPGSKWRFMPYMIEYFPLDMKTFIEPFFGGGSVSLTVADDPRFTKLERMIGGDLYTEMWALWSGIKKNPAAVVEIATDWFRGKCPHQNEMYKLNFAAKDARKFMKDGEFADYEVNDNFTELDRARIRENMSLFETVCREGRNFWNWSQTVDTSAMSLEQRAARMLLVNNLSFSGMGDSGSLSEDKLTEFKLEKMDSVYDTSRLLQRIELYNVSFEDTMKYGNDNPEGSFIFLDPPYAKQESSGLYGKNGDMHKGFPHEHFAEFTKAMKCKWFVTYDDSVIVRKLFSGNTYFGNPCYFKPFRIPGGYTMAERNAEDALAGEELFISNYDMDSINSGEAGGIEEFDF